MAADKYRQKGVNPYVAFLDNSVIKNRVGSWYVGLRQLLPAEYDLYDDDNPPPVPASFTGRLTSNYTLITYTSGCYHCQPTDGRWSSSGCSVRHFLTIMITLITSGRRILTRGRITGADFFHTGKLVTPTSREECSRM